MIGIDSVMIAIERKRAAWARLARDLPADCLGLMTETIGLDGLPDAAERILAGRVRGRIVVDTAR
jgi:acrylyl-CoA reductase (NADPH)